MAYNQTWRDEIMNELRGSYTHITQAGIIGTALETCTGLAPVVKLKPEEIRFDLEWPIKGKKPIWIAVYNKEDKSVFVTFENMPEGFAKEVYSGKSYIRKFDRAHEASAYIGDMSKDFLNYIIDNAIDLEVQWWLVEEITKLKAEQEAKDE